MKTAVVYSEKMKEYDFGPGHPFRGNRYGNFMKLFKEKLSGNPDFEVVEPSYATEEDLLLVHDPNFIERIKRSESRDSDTPLHPGMDVAARLIVGSSMLAGELVAGGRFDMAVGVGGGMHHAGRSREAGFCIFNDVAVCAKNLMKKYNLQRILILDTDAHTGDGTAKIFYSDPKVLFIDLHQDPRTLYPGWGFAHEIGSGEGRGYTVNVPMPPGASDRSYEYVLDRLFEPLTEAFKPEIIIRNGGSDPHFADKLTHLGLTLEGFKMIGRKVKKVADETCGGRVVDLPGSGYNPAVLPYGWLSLICGLTGVDLELKEPFPVPSWVREDRLEETKRVVELVEKNLRAYWRVFV